MDDQRLFKQRRQIMRSTNIHLNLNRHILYISILLDNNENTEIKLSIILVH